MCLKWDGVVFLLGGVSYSLIEILWRGYTHYTMVLLGGICFLALYKLFYAMKDYSLLEKCVAGALLITILEFTVGCIVNLVLHLNVWNYGKMPLNILGQVCILYSTYWGFLCIPINFLAKKIHSVAENKIGV